MTSSMAATGVPDPIRCLVIQLGGFREIHQSLMSLRAARELYPQLKISLVVQDRYAAPARRVAWLEQVVELPITGIVRPVLEGNKTEIQGLRETARWVSPLVNHVWDMILNWSDTESSSFLTGLLPARVKLGFSRKKNLEFSNVDGWTQYRQALELAGMPQNIHRTDVLTTQLLTVLQIRHGEPATAPDTTITSRSFFTSELADLEPVARSEWVSRDSGRRWMALRIGGRGPGPEFWCDTLVRLFNRHDETSIVLIGDSSDLMVSRELVLRLTERLGSEEVSSRLMNLTGIACAEQFDLLTAVVGGCHWLFTGPSDEAHLAAILGTRVLAVLESEDALAEEGPYGNGHYVLKPGAGQVSPEAVYAAWTYGSNEWSHRRKIQIEKHFAEYGWSDRLTEVNLFRTRIRCTDDGGGAHFEPLCVRPLDPEQWGVLAVEHLGRAWYCGWAPEAERIFTREQLRPEFARFLREIRSEIDLLTAWCAQAEGAAVALFRCTNGQKTDRLMTIEKRRTVALHAETLRTIDAKIAELARKQPVFAALESVFKVMMHNLSGDRLSELGEEAALAYHHLQEGAKSLSEWITSTLKLARPASVGIAPVVGLDREMR